MRLDDKGRCPECRRKPLHYKRDGGPHFFCPRCDRAFHDETHEQIPNWAWNLVDGELHAKYRAKG